MKAGSRAIVRHLLAGILILFTVPAKADAQFGRTWQSAKEYFPDFYGHIVEFAGRQWCMTSEGQNTCYCNVTSIWSSIDGLTWTRENLSSAITDTIGLAATTSELIVLGGYPEIAAFDGNVWYVPRWTGPSNYETISETEFRGHMWSLDGSCCPVDPMPQDIWRYDLQEGWAKGEQPLTPPFGYNTKVLPTDDFLLLIGPFYDGSFMEPRTVHVARSVDGSSWEYLDVTFPWTSNDLGSCVSLHGRAWVTVQQLGHVQLLSTENGLEWTSHSLPPAIEGSNYPKFSAFDGSLVFVDDTKHAWKSADGDLWRDTSLSPFSEKRIKQSTAVLDGYLWVYGGLEQVDVEKNDVWRSVDGVTWELVAETAPWSPRHGAAGVAFGGYIWLFGGAQGDEAKDKAVRLGDVWRSTDGVAWEEVTAQASWLPRYGAVAVEHVGKLWLIGGNTSGYSNSNLLEVWNSTDGTDWHAINPGQDFDFDSYFGCTTFQGELLATASVRCGVGPFLASVDGVHWDVRVPSDSTCDDGNPFSITYPLTGFSLANVDGTLFLPVCWYQMASDGHTSHSSVMQEIWVSRDATNWHHVAIGNGWDAAEAIGAFPTVFGTAGSARIVGGGFGADRTFVAINEPSELPQFDRDGDFHISLAELLRPIQLYNALSFHCENGTEDGFVPGFGSQECRAYAGDHLEWDWSISLAELLRVVQFYNSGGYHLCEGSEDGLCPGASEGAAW